MEYEKLHRQIFTELGDGTGQSAYNVALLKTLAPLLDARMSVFLEGFISIMLMWSMGEEPLEQYKGLFMDLLKAMLDAKERVDGS